MKLWIKTKIIGTGTDEDPRRPYLPASTHYSMLDLENECLCRITITPNQLSSIQNDTNIAVLTDDEALQIIKSINQNAELEDVDVADVELEELAKQYGVDPVEEKRTVIVPTRGRRVLQCQEAHLLRVIAKKKSVDISDIEEHIELGSKHAYNRALARIRGEVGGKHLYGQ